MSEMRLRIGIAGVGRMGALHAKICAGLPNITVSAVCDTDDSRGREISQEYNCLYCSDYRELAEKSDAVVVAAPTALHRELGEFFLNEGIPVLIEKPLAGTVEEADVLVEAADRTGTVLQVGHIERFNPAVAAVTDRVQNPLFIDCRRISPFPFRSTDVCVVLDLMIHDIDIILHLAKSAVRSLDAVGVKVLTSSEDIANARIVFENGCVADVTASRVAIKRERQIRIFQPDSYISLDYEENNARIITRKPGSEDIDITSLDPSKVGDPLQFVLDNLMQTEDIKVEEYNPLGREIQSFADCVRTGEAPIVNGRQGREAISVAESIRKAILSGQEGV